MEDVAAFEFVAEFLLAGEDQAVFGGEELLALAEHGVADEGVVLVGAEDDAEGGVVVRAAFEVIEQADIHVHLADVGVGELAGFEIEQDEAFQEVVVEDEIHIEMARLGADADLAADEGEAFAEFHEEIPQAEREGIFQRAFAIRRGFREAEKFEDVGVLNELRGVRCLRGGENFAGAGG